MSLSRKQKMYLHEMGITLWAKKVINTDNNIEDNNELLKISSDDLTQSTLFNDILQLLSSSFGEYTMTEQSVSFDFFTWSFSSEYMIKYHNNQLVTPAINVMTQSVELKKQLWQHLSHLSIKA